MSEHERLVMQQLRQDEALQLDELIERLEAEMVSGEIFTALFELELAGRVKQMPGKNYVRMLLSAAIWATDDATVVAGACEAFTACG